jgi:hypothetical protein
MKRGRVVSVERDGVKKEKGALSGGKGKAGARDAPRDARRETKTVACQNEQRRAFRSETSTTTMGGLDDETRARAVALADAPWCDPTGGSARYRTARPAASGRLA